MYIYMRIPKVSKNHENQERLENCDGDAHL